MTQSDKGLAKIAKGASPRRHAEISPVKVKDTHLMNNKLPPAEILCIEWQHWLPGNMHRWLHMTSSLALRLKHNHNVPF